MSIPFVSELMKHWTDLCALGKQRHGWMGFRWRYNDLVKFSNGEWVVGNKSLGTVKRELESAVPSSWWWERHKLAKTRASLVYAELMQNLYTLCNQPQTVKLESIDELQSWLTVELSPKKLNGHKSLISLTNQITNSLERKGSNQFILADYLTKAIDEDAWLGSRELLKLAKEELDKSYLTIPRNKIRLSEEGKVDEQTIEEVGKELNKGWIERIWKGSNRKRAPWVYRQAEQLIKDLTSSKGIEQAVFKERLNQIIKEAAKLSWNSTLRKPLNKLLERLEEQEEYLSCYTDAWTKSFDEREKKRIQNTFIDELTARLNVRAQQFVAAKSSLLNFMKQKWDELLTCIFSRDPKEPQNTERAIKEAIAMNCQAVSNAVGECKADVTALQSKRWDDMAEQHKNQYDQLIANYERVFNRPEERIEFPEKIGPIIDNIVQMKIEQQSQISQTQSEWLVKAQELEAWKTELQDYNNVITDNAARAEQQLSRELPIEEREEIARVSLAAMNAEKDRIKAKLEQKGSESAKQLISGIIDKIHRKQSALIERYQAKRWSLMVVPQPTEAKSSTSRGSSIENITQFKSNLGKAILGFKSKLVEQIKAVRPLMKRYKRKKRKDSFVTYLSEKSADQRAEKQDIAQEAKIAEQLIKEVKKCYREIALQCHPDKIPEEMQSEVGDLFKDLGAAKDQWEKYLLTGEEPPLDPEECIARWDIVLANLNKRMDQVEKNNEQLRRNNNQLRSNTDQLKQSVAQSEKKLEKASDKVEQLMRNKPELTADQVEALRVGLSVLRSM